MPVYQITYSCRSHVGKLRKLNQDNYLCGGHSLDSALTGDSSSLDGSCSSRSRQLFGVFDGMGGEYRGEIAAQIAAKTAACFKARAHHVLELTMLCREANDAICSYVKKNRLPSMGTTAAMLLMHRRSVTLCNVGDSRIYSFFDGALKQLSVDHVCDMGYQGKPPLSQNLGIPQEEMRIEPYTAVLPYRDGELFLICSDGLTDMLSDASIASTLRSVPFEQAGDRLLQLALEAGGRDNITVLLLKTDRIGFFRHR